MRSLRPSLRSIVEAILPLAAAMRGCGYCPGPHQVQGPLDSGVSYDGGYAAFCATACGGGDAASVASCTVILSRSAPSFRADRVICTTSGYTTVPIGAPTAEWAQTCESRCGAEDSDCKIEWKEPGSAQITCSSPGCGGAGRRPEHFAPDPRTIATDPCGEYFARMAELEAWSVPAFVRLARELRAHGAPPSLVRRASRAAEDEVRHTRTVRSLAKKHGANARGRVAKPPETIRDLESIATENEIEGCVRETYGALVAEFQARTAKNARVRRAMTTIARDEAAHATLARDVARWTRTKLSASARVRVARERARAFRELRSELARPEPSILLETCGLPTPLVARSLLAALARH